jgi:ribosomal protein S18 acetylase RimI-like enzyme
MAGTPSIDNLRIAQASIDLLDLLVPLFDAYRIFYKQPSNLDAARAFLQERITREQSIIFVAYTGDGQAVGFTQLYPSFSSVSMKPLWILNDLYVAENARRLGVAKALIERAREYARETGAKGLELATATDNRQAQALYESLGFVRDDEFYHYFLAV